MQFKLALVTVTLAAVAAAIPTGGGGGDYCNVGTLQCCNSVQQAGSPGLEQLLSGILGIGVGSVDVPVGLTCSPISVIGVPGNSCNAQPVCCSGNNFNGLVVLGCDPINVNL